MQAKELTVQEVGQVGQVVQAENDHQVLAMWLHGRPVTTHRAYAHEVQGLLAVIGKPLAQITLGDLQGYFSGLESLAPASRARAINAVKSLFKFAQRIGYLQFNPAAAILSPKIKNTLAERILSESDVHRLLTLEPHPRNRILLRLMYAAGLRVSEICGLHMEGHARTGWCRANYRLWQRRENSDSFVECRHMGRTCGAPGWCRT
jgi:integrase/recombinase XerD